MLVQGCYVVQIRLNGYSNPTGRCGGQACHGQSGRLYCCDSNLVGIGNCIGERHGCDSYFTYCLRLFGEVQLTSQRCISNQVRSLSNHNDGPLNFSQSTVLGLDNPLNLTGLDVPYNVSHFTYFLSLK